MVSRFPFPIYRERESGNQKHRPGTREEFPDRFPAGMPGRNLGNTVTVSIVPFLPFPFLREREREESGIARAGLLPFLPAIPGGKESGTASPRRHAPLRVGSPRERESRNWPPGRPGRRPQAQQPRGNATDATPSRLAPAPLRRLLPPARHVRCTGGSGARGQSKTRQTPADTPHLGGAHAAARHTSANVPARQPARAGPCLIACQESHPRRSMRVFQHVPSALPDRRPENTPA